MNDMKFKESLKEKYDGVNKNAWKKYSSITMGAYIRNINLNIKFKDYLPFYNMPCFYCGYPRAIGLDRLDSSIGYEKGNIVSCCYNCNMMKGILDPRDFVFQCKKISEYCVSIPKDHKSNIFAPQITDMLTISEHEKEMIRMCLDKYHGNKTKAAKELGILRGALRGKIKKYGIEASAQGKC